MFTFRTAILAACLAAGGLAGAMGSAQSGEAAAFLPEGQAYATDPSACKGFAGGTAAGLSRQLTARGVFTEFSSCVFASTLPVYGLDDPKVIVAWVAIASCSTDDGIVSPDLIHIALEGDAVRVTSQNHFTYAATGRKGGYADGLVDIGFNPCQ